MGLLSSIGKVVGTVASVAGAASGNPLLAIGSDLLGGMLSDSNARDAASTAWNREIGASNTAYQRAVTDMRAAGLNPILAYSQGGASVPTAKVASTTDYSQLGTRTASTALAQANSKSQIATNDAQAANLRQSVLTGQATAQNTAADTALTAEKIREMRLRNESLEAIDPRLRAWIGSGSDAAGAIGAGLEAGKSAKELFSKAKPNMTKRPMRLTVHPLPK